MIKVTVKRPNWLWRAFLWLWKYVIGSKRILGFTTFWRTVLIVDECWDDKPLLAHELTHVDQIYRLGIIEFTYCYIKELWKHGYRDNAFEIEAQLNARHRAKETINRFEITYK